MKIVKISQNPLWESERFFVGDRHSVNYGGKSIETFEPEALNKIIEELKLQLVRKTGKTTMAFVY